MRISIYFGLLFAGVIGMASVPAHADTGLVMVCKDSTSRIGQRLDGVGGTKCTNAAYVKPGAGSAVASCTTANCGTWANADSQWRRFDTLADTARVLKCTANIIPNISFALGTTGADPCPAASKPTPWTLKTLLIDTTQYTAHLTWEPPTQNEDGTPLTNLRGFYVFKSVGTDLVQGATTLPEGARLQKITGAGTTAIDLPINPDQKTFFAMTAYACDLATGATDCTDANKAESKLSMVVNVTKNSPKAPTLNFSCAPPAAVRAANITCTWTTTDADSCVASNGWTGTKAASGSETIAITESAMFNIKCTGPGGEISDSEPVIITPAPNTVTNLTVTTN